MELLVCSVVIFCTVVMCRDSSRLHEGMKGKMERCSELLWRAEDVRASSTSLSWMVESMQMTSEFVQTDK